MPKHTLIGKASDIPIGTCRPIEVDGFWIAVCNVDGEIHALDNTCPHAGGSLGEGTVVGELLRCPWHGWRFHVKTGIRPENPDFTVSRYPVTVIDEQVYVDVPTEEERRPAW
jgi:nitrite reductase/ring-hydroxylating ferredoxin subunit